MKRYKAVQVTATVYPGVLFKFATTEQAKQFYETSNFQERLEWKGNQEILLKLR
jgi:hypothetical protein